MGLLPAGAVAYLLVLAVFVVAGGKNYYLLGLLPPLAAAGSVVLAERRSAAGVRSFTVLVAATALLPLPALLPVLPAQTFADSLYPDLNEDGLETIGWPDVVAQVRGVVADLPPAQRRTAVIVTQNYGEAGALQWYGGTPPVYSGHNGYGDWGPPSSPGPVVYVGYLGEDRDALAGYRAGGCPAHRRRQRGGRRRGVGLRRTGRLVGAGVAAAAPPLGLTWHHADGGRRCRSE